MTKNSKKIMSTAALVLLLVVTSGVIAFTYSRYTSGATGSVGVTIAAWKVKVNTTDITANNTFTLTAGNFANNTYVKDNLIAPGVTATIPVKIDATGAEVTMEYTITVSALTVTPANANIIIEEKDGWTKTGNTWTKTGTIAHDRTGRVDTINIPLKWVDGNSTSANAADTANGTATTLSVTIPVSVTAKQKIA